MLHDRAEDQILGQKSPEDEMPVEAIESIHITKS